MKNLTILNTQIRTLDNLYSLTDFHKASGSEAKHKPALFLSNQQTKDLILEIENSKVGNPTLAVKTIRGGRNPSTYACLEIVIAYAAWISAEFHLKVIRAFMAINGIGTHPQQIALPEPEKTFSHRTHRIMNYKPLFGYGLPCLNNNNSSNTLTPPCNNSAPHLRLQHTHLWRNFVISWQTPTSS